MPPIINNDLDDIPRAGIQMARPQGDQLIDLCDLPIRKGLEGNSLRPLLVDPDTGWDRPLLTTHGRNDRTLRSKHFRYIRYADGSEELTDHTVDPMEWKNIAGDPAFTDAKHMLRGSGHAQSI